MATTLQEQEGGMAQQSSNDELQAQMEELVKQMDELVKALDEVADRNDLPQGAQFAHIARILSSNRDKQIISQLAKGKMVKLAILLPKIDDVLKQCKARPSPVPAKPKQQQKKKMPSVSDCNPFKSRSSSSPDQDTAAQPWVEPLLKEAIDIFGDVPPPPNAAEAAEEVAEAAEEVKYYEWTTSYVDETRIYGWDKEADEVVDALVGPRPPADQEENKDEKTAEADKKDAKKDEKTAPADAEELLFRAAGIVGIHGSGKTALAQKVFVHDRIKDAFPLRLWVCVGPPDSEDRAGLLYRMLDNLGLDTDKVEKIVNESNAVKAAKDGEDKEKSKIGVLLFILHVTLHNTGYLIVFDDIRAYSDWYSNLTLEPPGNKEWFERLAYGLPKVKKSAVLVTCRKEDDARVMVRTGNVFRPPGLSVDDGWMLFEREYKRAKAELLVPKKKGEGGSSVDVQEESKRNKLLEEKMKEINLEEDKIYKVLGEMKGEIVDKCLGLPVAIIEAAKGFAVLESLPDVPEETQPAEGTSKPEKAAQDEARQQDDQPA